MLRLQIYIVTGVLHCVIIETRVSYHVIQIRYQSRVRLDEFKSSMPLLKDIQTGNTQDWCIVVAFENLVSALTSYVN